MSKKTSFRWSRTVNSDVRHDLLATKCGRIIHVRITE